MSLARAREDVQTMSERCARYLQDPKDRKRLRFSATTAVDCIVDDSSFKIGCAYTTSSSMRETAGVI